jgi:hypothetical protein
MGIAIGEVLTSLEKIAALAIKSSRPGRPVTSLLIESGGNTARRLQIHQ